MANPFTSAQAQQTMAALPPDLAVQQQQLTRQQQMAEMLRKQSMEPSGGTEMVGGWAVKKSPWEGVSKVVQALTGGMLQNNADKKQSELTQQGNQQLVDGLQKYQSLLQGTPGQSYTVGEGQAGPIGTEPAVPGNKQAALAALLQSGHPMLQQMGIAQLTAKPESAFSKVDPKDYTQESVAKFAATNNFADLVPVRKMEVAPSGVAFNPYNVKEGTTFNDPNKPFNVGPDGNAVPNDPYQSYEIKKAIAGKPSTNVSVNTATKPFLQEVGKGAGEAVNAAYTGAQSAASTLQNVEQIRAGLKDAILGPGANVRVTLAQIGQTLGIGGKDASEQLQNTRQVIQGLARQELSAAGQMKGQGQITESERSILRRAEAGDISDFTQPELNTLLGAIEKTARYRINVHQQNMERLRQDPNAQGIVDYMQVNAPPSSNQAAPQPAAGGVRRFNPATGRIE